MSFEDKVNAVRESARGSEEAAEQTRNASPSWDDDMFKNGWPNCWGDFNNIAC
jgi:hypothetical protein